AHHLRDHLAGRIAAGADGPHRLVGNDDLAGAFELRNGYRFDLIGDEGGSAPGVADALVLADAEHRSQPRLDGQGELARHDRVGLAVDVAALGVAGDDVRGAGVAQHRRGDLAGERAGFLIAAVLRADADVTRPARYDVLDIHVRRRHHQRRPSRRPPPRFDSYSRSSARRRTSAALSPGWKSATPIETAQRIASSSSAGMATIRTRSRTRSATTRAPSRSVCGRMTANSSPPKRVKTSGGRSVSRTAPHSSERTTSPMVWPWRSLISLKSSTSNISTDSGRL